MRFCEIFTVALKMAVGRFKNMVGDCVWGGATDRFILARIIMVVIMHLSSGVYKTRCLRDGVRGVRARRGTTVKAFECKALYVKALA